MKKYMVVGSLLAGFVIGAVHYFSRMPQEVDGYARATAETLADKAEAAIPDEIKDRKLDNEVASVKQELIDREVQVNLAKRGIDRLQAEVDSLTESTERRKRLLVEAYPVLKSATEAKLTLVTFANVEQPLPDFQREIDDLLSSQDRETRQLEIKREGLARLKKSAEEGRLALAEMKRALDHTEQEVAVLRSRREQAEVESQTLDLVSSATAKRDAVGATVSDGLGKLKSNVDQLEARNEARRGTTSSLQRSSSNSIGRQWNRLESLKAIHDTTVVDANVTLPSEAKVTDSVPATTHATPVAPIEQAATKTKLEAAKVVISVEASSPEK